MKSKTENLKSHRQSLAGHRAFFKNLFLVVVMLFIASNSYASASFKLIDGMRYLVDTDAKTATVMPLMDAKYSGDVVIPARIVIDGTSYPVVALGQSCFLDCTELTSISIPNSVTTLGNGCFESCVSLTNLTIPSSVTTLEKGCFESCSGLTKVSIPSSITEIPEDCFASCVSLTDIDIPSSVTSLGRNCFYFCKGLTKIVIPSSVKSFDGWCFYACYNLTSVTLPSNLTTLGDGCFYDCKKLESINIPESITELGDFCFCDCENLENIKIPSSVTSLGNRCFINCYKLSNVEIPSSVTSLGEACLFRCKSLTSIKIPSSVTSIGEECFTYCENLVNVELSPSITEIPSECFRYCTSLASIKIPSSVTKLGYGCFAYCSSLESIIIPSSVDRIMKSTLVGCTRLESVYFCGKVPSECYFSPDKSIVVYVPLEYLQDYKERFGDDVTYIYAWNPSESGDDVKVEKCAVPVISFADGKLRMYSSTHGAEYHYTITDDDVVTDKWSQDGVVELVAAYKVTVYATANGYHASDKSVATLYWLKGELETDVSNVQLAQRRGIMVTTTDGIVSISGLSDGESVEFYAIDGKQVGAVRAVNGVASCAVGESVVIAKIGKNSLKIVVK